MILIACQLTVSWIYLFLDFSKQFDGEASRQVEEYKDFGRKALLLIF